MKTTLGERIKDRRLKLNLTQDELADKVDVSRNVLSSYESNRNVPPVNALCKIADRLKVSVDYLIGRSEDPYQIYIKEEASTQYSVEEQQLVNKFMIESEEILRTKGSLSEEKIKHALKFMKFVFEEDLEDEKKKNK